MKFSYAKLKETLEPLDLINGGGTIMPLGGVEESSKYSYT